MFMRTIALLLLISTPALGDSYDALRADPKIASGVLVAAIGDMIGDACPDLGERRLRSLSMLNTLVGRARALGYSVGEIRAYVEDDTEKERVRAQARAWLAARGGTDAVGICDVARAEIASASPIGRLMYEK